MLCENMRSGGNGDKLAQDVLGHFYIVLCNHQCFLDVLVRVSLTHEELNLTADLGVDFSSTHTAARRGRDRWDRTGSTFGVHSPW